jgi:hypothetical protein
MKAVLGGLAAFFLLVSQSALAGVYSERLCKDIAQFDCIKVKPKETWENLFPDETQRDIVKRINRYGNRLHRGMTIAVPKNLQTANVMDFAPFQKEISPTGEKVIMVSLKDMAWGAYDAQGTLVRWGPALSAKGYCPDLGRGCHTAKGNFAVYSKQGSGCVSTKFPIGRGGAPMPWCMFFHGGFALHGSYDLPGYNASHGCVRLFIPDAKWLNQEFTDIGTPVIVRP